MTPDDPVVTPIIAIASLVGAGTAIHSAQQADKLGKKQADAADALQAEARQRDEQTKLTDVVRKARDRQRALAAARGGRRETVKTTPLGLAYGAGQTDKLGAA